MTGVETAAALTAAGGAGAGGAGLAGLLGGGTASLFGAGTGLAATMLPAEAAAAGAAAGAGGTAGLFGAGMPAITGAAATPMLGAEAIAPAVSQAGALPMMMEPAMMAQGAAPTVAMPTTTPNALPMNKFANAAMKMGGNMMGQGQPQGGGAAQRPTSQAQAESAQQIAQRMRMQRAGRGGWAGLLGQAIGG